MAYTGLYSESVIYFTNKSKTKSWSVRFGEGASLIPIPPKGDYTLFGKKGELFAIELPEGEYEITEWALHSGYVTLTPVTPISIKFKIEPGQGTYVGQFVFNQTNRAGLTVTGVRVDYIDNFEEDNIVLDFKYPNVSKENIQMGVLSNASHKGLGGNTSASWDIPLVIHP